MSMARFLFQSDLQADFGNLQECEIALEELLAAANKYKPAAIIHAGDVKDAYSPVDVETVKFCVRMVRRIREAGHRIIILLGNHDRISQSAESRNWLDVLQAAGAEIVTKPRVKVIQGVAIGFLPYGVGETLIQGAKTLLSKTSGHGSGPKLLVFHSEITGSVINASGRLGKGVTGEDLGFEHYDACFGGHIHQHQKIADNAWYIGSPFCQDWGEADAAKGHLLVDIRPFVQGSDVPLQSDPLPDWNLTVRQLKTKIPHWYNVDYLERNGIKPEPGAYIRSKVPVITTKITEKLREEEERIRKKYGDVRIHTVPEIVDEAASEIVIKGGSDRDKLEQYVAATLPEDTVKWSFGQVVSYLSSKLDETREDAVADLRFKSVEGHNVLTFEQVKMKLDKLGLVLIRGVNEDWPGRSNGAGKSSTLSLLPIGMFGTVPNKKQKADAWAWERDDAPAMVIVKLDANDHKIEMVRGRRPHLIQLRIDGDDKSSGIRGTGKDETQGLIERVTGYDMKMLMNAVYIDQTVANGFVFGTPAVRMDLISRFQNLERFEKARRAVSVDIEKTDKYLTQLSAQIEAMVQEIESLEADVKEIKDQTEGNWAALLKSEHGTLNNLIEQHAAVTATAEMYKELQRDADELEHDQEELSRQMQNTVRTESVLRDRVKQGKKLIDAGKCPACFQPTQKAGAAIVATNTKQLQEATAAVEKQSGELREIDAKKQKLDKRIRAYEDRKEELEDKIDASRRRVADLQKAADEEDSRNKERSTKLRAKNQDLILRRRYYRGAMAAREGLIADIEAMEYAKKAFHRSGMPLYLSAALCPLLNRAADEYSDIFTDGNLKVSFRIEDGEFVVDVVNPAGSRTVEGQSVGEAAMAGVVCAFALREAAPKTNLLILDEPGHGLDAEGCRQFARGILKMKDRFETILLVTHSAYISSLLSGETVYTVVKKNGRSKLFLS